MCGENERGGKTEVRYYIGKKCMSIGHVRTY
jgi:hypothetical protein